MTLAAPPLLSTDMYRYVWDGRVQLAGINPYRYLPVAPALEFLRDDAVYPHINRADYAHTIYPPAAQMIFALAAGGHAERVRHEADDGAVRRAGDRRAVPAAAAWRDATDPELLIYAWMPLPVWEFAGNAHVDAVAAGLLALALLVSHARSRWRGAASSWLPRR